MSMVHIAVIVLAAAAGYLFAVISGSPARPQQTARQLSEQRNEPGMLKQYKNFLYYDGTGKGQTDIEDKN